MNTIKFKMSNETLEIIKQISHELRLSNSQILREVLIRYKKSYESRDITKKDRAEYSVNINIRPTNDITLKDYGLYAESISNKDIIEILSELYTINF